MSASERWREVDALLDAALDLPAEGRAAFLDARAPDPELRAQVERLLAAALRADEFLPPGAGLDASVAEEVLADAERHEAEGSDALPGTSIDAFRLTRKLGTGGMGEVWEAEQLEPVRRRVALKLVRFGMDSQEVVRRFELERQALALMNHPNVAQVFGGGTSPSGRSYFVMEYVPGVPVTRYCDSRRLSIEERLALFLQVCEGVQHAHHKGLIHRDLKPSNILVAEVDGQPVPKIIDFGVARALEERGQSALTEVGQIVGTLEYMSPEQADTRVRDVDTRADVYALGVLLYELLSGVRPFDDETLKAAGLLELLRRIRETDPLRPSLRADPTVSRRLQGELDWIVMKAIEKERARRYDSPRELAEDVRRHLAHEAVLAGPPSRTYKLKKLLRRHRATALASGVALLALVGGTVVALTQAVRATHAERAARQDALTARQVSDFMVELFEVSDPERARGTTVTARELLDRGAKRVQDGLGEQPLVKARLQGVIGEIYGKLGFYEAARPLLEASLKAREHLQGLNDVEAVRALGMLGQLLFASGDKAAAERMQRLALARLAAGARPDPVVEAQLHLALASPLRETARYPEAEAEVRRGLELLTRTLGPEHADVGGAWHALAGVLKYESRHPDAERAYRRAIAIMEKALGPDHARTLSCRVDLAGAVGSQGRDVEAEALLTQVLGPLEKIYGPEHLVVANTVSSLAVVYGRQGRLDEAMAALERAYAVRAKILGPDHPDAAGDLQNIGLTQTLKADYAGAQRTFERTLLILEPALGPDHPRTAWVLGRLGALHVRLAHYDAAEAAYRRALVATEKTFGPGHQNAVSALRGLADVELRRGRLDAAEPLIARALAICDKPGSADQPANVELPGTLSVLAELRRRQQRLDDARQALERARDIQSKSLRPGHPGAAGTLVLLADVLVAQGRLGEAEGLYREALKTLEKALGPEHPDVARALFGLGVELGRRGARGEAAGVLRRALEIRSTCLGKAHPDTVETAAALAALARAPVPARPQG